MPGYLDDSFWDILTTYWDNGKKLEADVSRVVGWA